MNSLLLVAHGSRREASNDEIRTLTGTLHRQAGNCFDEVSCAFLELAEPSIPDGIRNCIERGANHVTVFPYFLSAGRHVTSDIPAEVNQIAREHPEITIMIAPYLGAAGAMSELILQQAGQTTHTEENAMRIQTTDPINGKDVTDTEHAPFVIEGRGADALRIYFDSHENRQTYLAVETDQLGGHNVAIYNQTTGSGREM
jgi:sirohydrochlorin ferrochelatase